MLCIPYAWNHEIHPVPHREFKSRSLEKNMNNSGRSTCIKLSFPDMRPQLRCGDTCIGPRRNIRLPRHEKRIQPRIVWSSSSCQCTWVAKKNRLARTSGISVQMASPRRQQKSQSDSPKNMQNKQRIKSYRKKFEYVRVKSPDCVA